MHFINRGKATRFFPPETSEFFCEKTGIRILQITNYPANHHNLYLNKSSFTPDGEFIIFLSNRNGPANLFCCRLGDGTIFQLTFHSNSVRLFSAIITRTGENLYYVVDNQIRRIDLLTGTNDMFIELPDSERPSALYLTEDDRFLVTRIESADINPIGSMTGTALASFKRIRQTVKRFQKKPSRIVRINTHSALCETVHETRDRIGIVLPSPNGQKLAYLAYESQLWSLDMHRGDPSLIYDSKNRHLVVHPCWLTDDELVFAEWPNAIKTVSLSGKVRTLTDFEALHLSHMPDIPCIACDSAAMDAGIYLISKSTGAAKLVCIPKSDLGGHWHWKSYLRHRLFPFSGSFWVGNEWFHPHPSWSWCGTMLSFNSTMHNAYSQVFVVSLEKLLSSFMSRYRDL